MSQVEVLDSFSIFASLVIKAKEFYVKNIKENIKELFEIWSGESTKSLEALPESGSYRRYYRVYGSKKQCIAVYNEDKKENTAFVEFSKHFYSKGLSVPAILAEDKDNFIYLQNDLGDTTLFEFIENVRKGIIFPDELVDLLKKVLDELIRFQVLGTEGLDYSVCYPRAAFDKQSMMWDLNYFKYYFLKLAKIPFYEQDLEDDFQKFTDFLLKADANYFLYRDFQSRNIMIKDGKPYFIDYQGGRRGALAYDLASLLYDAKADIPQEIRNELRKYYISRLADYGIDGEAFERHYFGYVLIRIMQAMGAFGFRGFYEKKTHFLQSIPYAVQNLEYLLDTVNLPIEVPELWKVLRSLTLSEELMKFKDTSGKLTVNVFSFSYKKGIPKDESGNGGGFVFDCRSIHNPGRYEQYFKLTGKDKDVIDFFEKENEMEDFLQNVFPLVDNSVNNYSRRNFKNLMVAFGCTGGQHRSVYAAERLAVHLKKKFDIEVVVTHREQSF
jgi:aminoglycoside/choline kinase family phosphotransferase